MSDGWILHIPKIHILDETSWNGIYAMNAKHQPVVWKFAPFTTTLYPMWKFLAKWELCERTQRSTIQSNVKRRRPSFYLVRLDRIENEENWMTKKKLRSHTRHIEQKRYDVSFVIVCSCIFPKTLSFWDGDVCAFCVRTCTCQLHLYNAKKAYIWAGFIPIHRLRLDAILQFIYV